MTQETLKRTSASVYRMEWEESLSNGLARLAGGGIDVLLLDVGLPDSQGLAALTPIKALAPDF